jgi:hypothetical protein
VIAQLAANYPLPRTNPNATPVADILNPSFFRFSNFWGFSPENSLFSANSNDFEIITH